MRALGVWFYLVLAAIAVVALPGHDPRPLSAPRPPGADARARARASARRPRSTTAGSRIAPMRIARLWSTPTSPNSQPCGRRRRGAPARRARAGQVLGGLVLLGAGELMLAVSDLRHGQARHAHLCLRRGRRGGGRRGARGACRRGRQAPRVGAAGRAGGRPAPAAGRVRVRQRASRSRWPTTASSGGSCRSTSCSRPARSRSLAGAAVRIPAPDARAPAGGRLSRRRLHRLRLPVAHLGRPSWLRRSSC